ncbi:uncharacterized protein LOC135153055 [Lytechinus pictus]|uniref:uncharacterized protein LOC135153055 n=1 Tax=Lytechinus pictus TaxID=7653 RepID=UPI00240E44DC|nr:uncharacterized protein LOC129278086 [Lytechinus pictus]XP_054770275.1 uncharacterized protein LOC129278086 [Lytechinus pictus]
MANSFSILLSYIDNLLWGCTQIFYGIVFIINFNYQLVTSLYRCIIQLWALLIQTVLYTAKAFVFSIEFLAELPVWSYHMGKYLIDLVQNLMSNAIQGCMSWSWEALVYTGELLGNIVKNLLLAFMSVWTQFLNLVVFQFTLFAELFTSLIGSTYSHMKEAKGNTVQLMHSVGSDTREFVHGVCSLIYEFFITGVAYPISFVNACTQNMIDGLYIFMSMLKAIEDFVIGIFEVVIELLYSSISIIMNVFYDIVNAFKEISTFFINAIDYVGQALIDCFDSAAEGYSSLNLFVGKNWGALLALALCVTLVWVTINMNGQHERNIQHIIQDLTRLVNNFTTSRSRNVNREPLRPEGHLHQDVLPEDQQQGDLDVLNEGEENGDDGMDQDVPAGEVGGVGDQPGPSRSTHHTPYSFRSRPFTPSGEPAEGSGSVEYLVSKLKNRLSEEQERQACVVCLDAVKNTLFMPCRHLCVCVPCADRIVSNDDIYMRICPLCRSRIGSIVEVYS